jgi:hypothetical protein
MNIKICTKCKIEKTIDSFNKDPRTKDGLGYWCKECTQINWFKHNPQKTIKIEDPINKKYCSKCKIEKDKIKFHKNKSKSDGLHSYCKSCKSQYSKSNQYKWYQNNKEKIKKRANDWKKLNPEYESEYRKDRRSKDVNFKIRELLSRRLGAALKGKTKSYKTLELLGCNLEECKYYIENQFEHEMNWGNHGIVWEVDHIKPCASFDLTKEEEQKKCFHYTNLKPLFKTTQVAMNLGYENYIGNRNKHVKYQKEIKN